MSDISAILIVRQGSTRLPGKGMKTILGRSLLSLIIERLKNINEISQICVATSNLEIDQPILDVAKEEGVISYAGHPEDVLDRLYHASRVCNAKIIYEVGGDCPLVDRGTLVHAYQLMKNSRHDFVHNFAPTTYPDGLDCPLITYDCLERVHRGAVMSSHRIHPFSYIVSHPEEFSVGNFVYNRDCGHLRLTLDYPEDLKLLKEIFERLYPVNPYFTLEDVIELLEEHPDLPRINAHYVQPLSPEGYWNTLAYIDDLHDDLVVLIKATKTSNQDKQYGQAVKGYSEILHMVANLKQRAIHLQNSQSDEVRHNI